MKERQERERIEREERERREKEEKDRKERERQERFEKRRLEREQKERERLEGEIESPDKIYSLTHTNPRTNVKNKQFGIKVNRILQSPQLSEIAKEEDHDSLINDNILGKPIKRLYFKKNQDYLDNDEDVKDTEGRIMDDKKRYSLRTDISKGEDTINISKTFKRSSLKPTKIKVFKCVVWKNTDPTIDEDTLKTILHRSGSQIFERGGFVLKLPKNSMSQKK